MACACQSGVETWRDYPTQLPELGVCALFPDPRVKRLIDRTQYIFANSIDAQLIKVTAARNARSSFHTEEDKLLQELSQSENCSFRILTLSQRRGIGALQVTLQCMLKILTQIRASPSFLDVILRFGTPENTHQESSGALCLEKQDDGSFDLAYQLKHVERRAAGEWQLRQLGLLHRYNSKTKSSSCVLLTSAWRTNSEAQKRLEKLVNDMPDNFNSEYRSVLEKHPLNVHLIILSAYIHNWQACLDSIAQDYIDTNRKIPSEGEAIYDSAIHHGLLAQLYHIEESLLLKVWGSLRSNLAIVKSLREWNDKLSGKSPAIDSGYVLVDDTPNLFSNAEYAAVDNALRSFETRLNGHIDSAELFQKRLSTSIAKLSTNLDLKSQRNTTQLNDRMRQENESMRVITLVGMIYLPSAWVASLFGSNFFALNGGKFEHTSLIWIYFVVAIPLTIATVLMWKYGKIVHRLWKEIKAQIKKLSI